MHLSLGAGPNVGKEGLLGIRSGGKRSTTWLLDAEFPKFRQLLPAEHTAVASMGVAELTEAIKLVALVADRGAQVRMEFSDGSVRLSAGADDVGRAEEDLPVEFAGEPLTIAFNPTYLTDGLGCAFGSGGVRLHHAEQAGGAAGRVARRLAARGCRAVPRRRDRLRVSADAGATPRLVRVGPAGKGFRCSWGWLDSGRWASTCAHGCAPAVTT